MNKTPEIPQASPEQVIEARLKVMESVSLRYAELARRIGPKEPLPQEYKIR